METKKKINCKMGLKDQQVAYLLAGIAAIWLLATVCPFVSLHMVLLDKTHVTLVTAKRLLSWEKAGTSMLGLVACTHSKRFRYTIYPSAETHHCGSSHAAGAGISEWSSCYTDCTGKASHLCDQEYNHPPITLIHINGNCYKSELYNKNMVWISSCMWF